MTKFTTEAEMAEMRERSKERLAPYKALSENPVRRGGRKHTNYTNKQKLTAVTTMVATGSLIAASQESGIQYPYLKVLAKTEWWKETIKDMRAEADELLDTDMSEIINSGMVEIKDRLKNGDWMWNSKENKFIRKKLKSTDALKITTSMMDQRNVMRGKPTRITENNNNITDRLNKLALEFADFNKAKKAKPVEIIDDVTFTEIENDAI